MNEITVQLVANSYFWAWLILTSMSFTTLLSSESKLRFKTSEDFKASKGKYSGGYTWQSLIALVLFIMSIYLR